MSTTLNALYIVILFLGLLEIFIFIRLGDIRDCLEKTNEFLKPNVKAPEQSADSFINRPHF